MTLPRSAPLAPAVFTAFFLLSTPGQAQTPQPLQAVQPIPAAQTTLKPQGTLEKIAESGAIIIGHREASLPFSYISTHGTVAGFSIELCQHIVQALKDGLSIPKLAVRLQPVTSTNRIPMMIAGEIDLECGSTSNNAARQDEVAFAPTHFTTRSVFVAKQARNLRTIDDLRGRRVVAVAGSTNMHQLRMVNAERQLGITIIPAKDHDGGFLIMDFDGADAFVLDEVLLAGLVASSPSPKAYRLSQESFGPPEPYGIMLRKNDPEFKRVVDQAIRGVLTSPAIKDIYTRWFMEPIPPTGINLRLPMNDSLVKAYANPTDSPDPAAY
jgi:glutamate/aspartate transport system substrate-binding protein